MSEHQERFEVIAAFADGERVDTIALREALADEAGREFLIDLVAMREIVTGTTATTGTTGTGTTRRTMMAVAAALAMAVGVAGYAVGQQRSRFVPVAVLAPLESDVVVSMEAPPTPTEVIRLDSNRKGSR